jgi:hypothetical protein
MSREFLHPGDYNPPPPEIERMFVGFAELRARAAAKRAAREIAHPESTTDLRFDATPGPSASGAAAAHPADRGKSRK